MNSALIIVKCLRFKAYLSHPSDTLHWNLQWAQFPLEFAIFRFWKKQECSKSLSKQKKARSMFPCSKCLAKEMRGLKKRIKSHPRWRKRKAHVHGGKEKPSNTPSVQGSDTMRDWVSLITSCLIPTSPTDLVQSLMVCLHASYVTCITSQLQGQTFAWQDG